MAGFSYVNASLFVLVLVTQVLTRSLLPKTEGFLSLSWTITCLATYAVSIWGLSQLIARGVQLNLLFPLLGAVVPFSIILVGIFFYKESASVLKISILCASCGLIGLAGAVK